MNERDKSLEGIVGMLCSDISATLLHLNGDFKEVDKAGRKIAPENFELLQKIREAGIVIALVTGMRENSYNDVRDSIPHDYSVIEHGGIILKDGIPDHEWYELLKSGIVAVQLYKSIVQRRLSVDDVNRTTSFRIVPDVDEGLTVDSIATILKSVQEYIPEDGLEFRQILIGNIEYSIPVVKGVKLFLHEPKPPEYACMEFVPEKSGKSNAIEFLAGRFKIGWERIAAFGDDTNDIEMLAKAGWGMTFGNSKYEVRRAIPQGRGFITSYSSHRGTTDVLEHFIGDVIPQLKERINAV